MMGRFIQLYNRGQMRAIGCGYRSVYIEEGRKWVKVLDWGTGEQSRVSRRELSEMEVSDRPPPRLKYLREGFKRNQRSKKMYKAAIASVREERLQKTMLGSEEIELTIDPRWVRLLQTKGQ